MDIRGEAGRGGLGHEEAAYRADDQEATTPLTLEPLRESAFDDAFAPEGGGGRERALAVVAVIAAIGWLAGMLWIARDSLPGLAPVALVQFIAALCVVPALIGILWLLAMRSSRAEAHRFGRTADMMRAEADTLERRVARLSDAIEANRLRIGEQAATLFAIGETAQDQLSAIGSGLAREISAVDGHTRALVDSAASTQANLGILLASIPRAESAIEAAGRLLHQTGLSTSEHASALHAQVVALAERGREADLVAGGAAQRLEAHITRMEATSETAGARLESVTGEMSDAVDALLGRTADAVDHARRGIAAQGDAMLAMITASQAALDSTARDSAETLAQRIATVEAAIDRIAERLETQRISGDAIVTGLDQGLAGVGVRLDALHDQGVERSQLLAASISALGGSATAMTEALRTGEAMATRTIGTTETLLIALDAAAREIDETLPEALARLDARIASSKSVVVDAKPELLALVTAAQSTHEAIEAIADVIAEQRRTLDTLSSTLIETLDTGRVKADELGQMVDETIGRTHRFSDEAAPQLIDALLRVRDTATVAADRARETLTTVIPEAATALETASAEAMRRATSDTVERQVRAIGEASDAAVAAATNATEKLALQVQAIVEQTALVENRIEDARAERDEAESNSFARRVTLLIEALHSASIDITKSFAPEVTDSAWAAYLKGDRGVFTRRAVRILDASEAREVARFYDDDAAFRDLVNRYIHDFEAMLRAILAQREGSPMGVTLLSSDMGKLYVALAQAIERLR